MFYPGFADKAQRYQFFRAVSQAMREKLPAELRNFADHTEEGNNWMRLTYPANFPYGFYELQFATDKSGNHTRIYGAGHKTVLNFYYGNKGKLIKWLAAINAQQAAIESAFGQKVMIGRWSENYVSVGLRLPQEKYDIQPDPFTKTFAHFIQATYPSISLAYQACG